MKTQLRDNHPYADWIKTYSDPEFEALAATLETLLDATAGDNSAISDAYRYAMLCERDFFAAPLTAG
jgi:thiaminase/transcriptional activator TenA